MKKLNIMFWSIIGLSIIDIGTTVYLRGFGFVELNPFAAPFLGSTISLIILKIVGLTICFLIISYSLKLNRLFAEVQNVIVILVSAAVCINNFRYMVMI